MAISNAKEGHQVKQVLSYSLQQGHDTEDCIKLRKMLAKMIVQRKLKEFLNHNHSSRRDFLMGLKSEIDHDDYVEQSFL